MAVRFAGQSAEIAARRAGDGEAHVRQLLGDRGQDLQRLVLRVRGHDGDEAGLHGSVQPGRRRRQRVGKHERSCAPGPDLRRQLLVRDDDGGGGAQPRQLHRPEQPPLAREERHGVHVHDDGDSVAAAHAPAIVTSGDGGSMIQSSLTPARLSSCAVRSACQGYLTGAVHGRFGHGVTTNRASSPNSAASVSVRRENGAHDRKRPRRPSSAAGAAAPLTGPPPSAAASRRPSGGGASGTPRRGPARTALEHARPSRPSPHRRRAAARSRARGTATRSESA